jgi:hypothetical protein
MGVATRNTGLSKCLANQRRANVGRPAAGELLEPGAPSNVSGGCNALQ